MAHLAGLWCVEYYTDTSVVRPPHYCGVVSQVQYVLKTSIYKRIADGDKDVTEVVWGKEEREIILSLKWWGDGTSPARNFHTQIMAEIVDKERVLLIKGYSAPFELHNIEGQETEIEKMCELILLD